MNESLTTRDKRVIWHPFTPQKYMPEPIPVVKGEGIYLIDEAGRRYLDAISSWWVTIHGHAHPYIAQKVFEQASTLEQVIFAGFTHEPAVRLAERLLELLPGNFARVFYSDNGSTATEVAIKMSIQYWWNQDNHQRNKILALTNAYHGDTFGAMSISGRSIFTMAFQDKLFEVIFIDPSLPESSQAEELRNDTTKKGLPSARLEELAAANNIPWDEIACFIYEPLVQGAGGMIMYDAANLEALLQKCHQHQIVCIADEVMTGFGRTGQFFASAYLKEQPDIICLSKGLTGGTMPMSVTACKDHIYQAFVQEEPLKTFFHGHSFTANPIACAASLASLDLLLLPNTLQQIRSIGEKHQAFVQVLKGLPAIKDPRCLGTLLAFEIEQGTAGYLNNISQVVTEKALERGVYIRPLGNTVYVMPPYCITMEQLDEVYNVVRAILAELT